MIAPHNTMKRVKVTSNRILTLGGDLGKNRNLFVDIELLTWTRGAGNWVLIIDDKSHWIPAAGPLCLCGNHSVRILA